MNDKKRKTRATRGSASPLLDAEESRDSDAENLSLPIVAIGASAGGLEALQQLFRALPSDSGAGFVVIQHLARDLVSMLAEILSRATTMPVVEVQDEPLVEANRVYVIPPDRDMTIAGGRLHLVARSKERGIHRPIDQFFRGLAAEQGQQAIGVVLSGTGNDGTLGLEEIKAEGGITFAQDETAQHDGMPHSAIASGCVDLVMAPDEIAREIARVVRYPQVIETEKAADDGSRAAIATILKTLHNATGVDFNGYKTSSLTRRINRRMVLQKIDGLKDYADLLTTSPVEADALYQDILISVTSFFRDPELFESLKTKVFPRLAQDRSPQDAVRAWVLGCSTGEEAYSLAIAWAEFAQKAGSRVPIQIFATDLNAAGIEKARAGVYAKTIDQDVSLERLRNFFNEVDGHYRIAKQIRDEAVFARHNVLADPPFSHVDMISCRNLLIYLDPVLQKRVIPLFHYALNPDGALVLGSSESIGSFGDLFEIYDAKQKIFRRKAGPSRPSRPVVPFVKPPPFRAETGERKATAASYTRKGSRTPAKVPSSTRSLEVENARLNQELTLTRETLQSIVEQQEAANEELQSANEETQSSNEELQSVNEELETSKEEIQSSNEELVTVNEELQNLNHELGQLNNDMVNLFASVRAPIVMLGRDLRIRRFNPAAEKVLNLIPADVGRPIGDIKFALNISDLESLLAEVVNDVVPKEIEVQDKTGCWYLLRILPYKTLENKIDGVVLMLVDVHELKLSQSFAQSIVSTMPEPLLILDSDLRVVSANAAFYSSFEVNRQETEGRRLYDLGNRQWDIPGLRQRLETILPREMSLDGFVVEDDFERIGWKIMRLNARPLTWSPGELPLILLAIEDVTQEVQLQRIADVALRDAPLDDLLGQAAQLVCKSLDADACSILLLDDDEATMQVRAIHGLEAIEPGFAVPAGEGILGKVVATRAPVVIDDLAAEAEVAAVLPEMKSMKGVPIASGDEAFGALLVGSRQHRHFTDRHLDLLRLCAQRIAQAIDREARLIAERKARDAAESESKAKDNFFAALSHELRTPMTSILGWAQLVEHTAFDPEMVPKAVEQIGSAARTQARLIDDMFDVSRLTVGQLAVRFERLDLRSVVEEAVKAAEPIAGQRRIRIETHLEPAIVSGDPTRLRQVFANLLANAIKFSEPDAPIRVVAERDGNQVSVSVIDQGKGIAAEFLPQIFRRFSQQEKGQFGGLGLGLSIAHHLVKSHGGTITAESEGEGRGATFRVTLPLAG
jgi:two-component system CheB/CheR fusion protein